MLNNLIIKLCACNKKAILVDYFDTFVYTYVYRDYIPVQIAKGILCKYSKTLIGITEKEIVCIFNRALCEVRKLADEASFRMYAECVFQFLLQKGMKTDSSKFYVFFYNLYFTTIAGCQYRNDSLYACLLQLKKKGLKLFLVSDFYLPKESYLEWFKEINSEGLFEEIYISSSVGLSKRTGAIYDYVLKKESLRPSEVLMIGDNLYVDFYISRSKGITAFPYLSLFHRIKQKLEWKFQKFPCVFKKKLYSLQKDKKFGYCVLPYLFFVQRLYKEASAHKDALTFLSRDGLFLKSIFDDYQKMCVDESNLVEVAYLMNSRVVNQAARNDKLAKELLKGYVGQFVKNNSICLVDNGWKCSSQIAFRNILDIDTKGYYIGVNEKPHVSGKYACERKGLIFDIDKDGTGTKSLYYSILYAKCKFIYEQFLTIDEGTLVAYKKNGNEYGFELHNDINNHFLFSKYIDQIQRHIRYNLKALLAWNQNGYIPENLLAKYMLRSVVISSKNECRVENDCRKLKFELYDFNNHIHQKTFTNDPIKELEMNSFKMLNLKQLIFNPIHYVTMFAALQKKFTEHPLLWYSYYPFAYAFYYYCLLFTRFRS